MRYAIATIAFLAVIAVGRANEITTEEPKAAETKSDESEYTVDQLLDAKRAKEKRLAALRAEVLEKQSRLSGSRLPLDSPARAELKSALAEKKSQFAEALKQPVPYWVEQALVDRKLEEEQAAKAIEAAKVARAQADVNAKRDAERLKKDGPLIVEAGGLRPNVIGIPDLTLVVANRSQQAIVAYTIAVECRNRFDNLLADIGDDSTYRGISQSTVSAGAKERGTWTLHNHKNTTKVRVWFTRARFADGTEWSQSADDAMANRNFVRIEMN